MDSLEKIRQHQKEFIEERNWGEFQSPKNLSMALAAEAGELLEVFMWLNEKQVELLKIKYPHLYQNAREEISDVLIYLVRLADVLNIDLLQAALEKIEKNKKKYPIEKAHELLQSVD